MSDPAPNVPFLFKKRSKTSSSARSKFQRQAGSSSEEETQVVRTTRKVDRGNPMVHRSKNRGVKQHAEESSEDSDDLTSAYKSSRISGREGPSDMGATSTLQIETEKDRDAQAIFERSLLINKETRGQADDKIYKGVNNYTQFFEKRDTAQGNAASGSVRKGPIRAPDHLRATVRWDYQPDLCKDYKETGFCGFGDSCKFLHDRTDYKFGWQLEVEGTKKGGDADSEDDYEIPSDSEEHLPFRCLLCRESFIDPVVTKCRHYFCEKCALEHHRKNKRCYVCAENTMGMFMPAKEIIARLKGAAPHDGKEDGD